MNVLLVDDQSVIVNSVKNGVRWETLSVEQIYTATSALEAKLVFMNFQVDLLITDIEMPGESGIELAEWSKSKFEDLEIVFLTSHPDFTYTKQAIRLRVFDYVLQPVKYTDIENTIRRVQIELGKKRQTHTLQRQVSLVKQQRNAIFDSLIIKCQSKREQDVHNLWKEIIQSYTQVGQSLDIYVMLINIQHWLKLERQWPDSLISLIFSNVQEELLEEVHGTVTVANMEPGKFWAFLLAPVSALNVEKLEVENRMFFDFIKKHLGFRISMYVDRMPVRDNIASVVEQLLESDERNLNGKCEIFYKEGNSPRDEREDIVEKIIAYVHENVWKKGCNNVTRADAAAYVSMNQEYMSRIFKERTGISYKDYVLQEKMKFAEKLLRETNMSVSVIASKVGFSNFSHFSSMFKRFYQDTPLDYKKKNG